MKAGWVLPSFIEGSGGHRTIMQNIQCLIDHGYECDVYIEDRGDVRSNEELKKQVETFFGECSCNYYLGFKISGRYDILFATAWFTAKVVRDYTDARHKAYFIQDFEALFNPMGDGYLLACASYCYGLSPITIGRWLTHKMQEEYHAPSQYFDFCADHKIYHPIKDTLKETAICFIYQPDKPRRCSSIGIEALGIVKYLRPDIKLYLYGSEIKENIWFEHTNLGLISIKKCNELYNKCRVGLCISSSNPSRIPFEMMSAGLPVVDLFMDNNFYDMPDGGVILAHYTPESIAQALIDVIDHPEQAAHMSAFGLKYMEERTLEYGYDQFYKAVANLVNNQVGTETVVSKIYNQQPVIASAVLQNRFQIEMHKQINNHPGKLLSALKHNRFLRRNKTIRKIWHYIKGY